MQARELSPYYPVSDTRPPFFFVSYIPFTKCNSGGSVAQSVREKMRTCWDDAQKDLIELSKSGNYGQPIRTMFEQFNTVKSVTLPLASIGVLVREENADRLRQIRASLQTGTLVKDKSNPGQWRFTQEQLAEYLVGIMASRQYGFRDRRKKASDAEPKT